ncbi:MAG: phytanoyl-CoA dioxygenase family protein, partial [SAR324 cluster bacterium]|nr:phytanoyl-CoA dioxygenase family protein [SAR324 cluster bacterium]
LNLLTTSQMAEFAAKGCLRFDGLIDSDLNQEFLDLFAEDIGSDDRYVNRVIPNCKPGTYVSQAFPQDHPLSKILAQPVVAGTLKSLMGTNPIFDHHHVHMTFPNRSRVQTNHQDSTIDLRSKNFDIQMIYFPHEVNDKMGGTRYIPGTHLRTVHESQIARYQNIRGQICVACPAGTIIFFHHGIWHGGGKNTSDVPRIMYKLRLQPSGSQSLQWDTSDLTEERIKNWQRPIFHAFGKREEDDVPSTLMSHEPWFDNTSRLEYMNRVRFWRTLLNDAEIDIDYWLTRVENEPASTNH